MLSEGLCLSGDPLGAVAVCFCAGRSAQGGPGPRRGRVGSPPARSGGRWGWGPGPPPPPENFTVRVIKRDEWSGRPPCHNSAVSRPSGAGTRPPRSCGPSASRPAPLIIYSGRRRARDPPRHSGPGGSTRAPGRPPAVRSPLGPGSRTRRSRQQL